MTLAISSDQSVLDWLGWLEGTLPEEEVWLKGAGSTEEGAVLEEGPFPQEASIMQALKARRMRFFFMVGSLLQ